MSYTKNPTWQPLVEGGTKVTAAKLNHIEDGVEVAASVADQALGTASQALSLADQAVRNAVPGAENVQGLYAKVKPTPSGATLGLLALAKDASNASRLWVQGQDFGQLGFTDDDGDTWTPKVDLGALVGAQGVHQLLFAGGFTWLVVGNNTSKSGQVWRSPLPDASGNGLSFTKVFDLASPPSSLVAGTNSFFRPQCLAVSGTNVYVLEYGTTVTGGPSLFYNATSGNIGSLWTKPKTWANAKHGHAVRIVEGVPLVMLGDSGASFTDIGLWRPTALDGSGTWNRISQYGEASGGNTLYGISFLPVTVNGKAMLAVEYDGALNLGPLLFPDSGTTATVWPFQKTFEIPAAYYGTNRCLTLTPEGNLMFANISENLAFGPNDTIWISKPPFTSRVLLDSIPGSSMPWGEGIVIGNYLWMGVWRFTIEKFVGQ